MRFQRKNSSLNDGVIVLFLYCIVLWVSSGTIVAVESASSSESKCSRSGSTYYCPNCGGMDVSDCFDCDGYFSTDTKHDICFNRKLFTSHNTNPEEPDDYYRFLWNDLVGAVVWFACAGVATACGVGGGGIYVPLGILLFQFAPKQASGLSQASIFGASVGGLILNIMSHHPCQKTIRSDAGIVDDEADQESQQQQQQQQQQQGGGEKTPARRHLQQMITKEQEEEYAKKGGKFYTRPLVHYDMALFLAPMEMAGAVLGLLIQKILPNWLYLMIAGLILAFTSYKTFKKFLQARQKETRAKQLLQQQQEQEAAAEQQAEQVQNDNENGNENNINNQGDSNIHVGNNSIEVGNTSSSSSSMSEDKLSNDDKDDALIPINHKEDNHHHHDRDDEETKLRKKFLEEDMRQYPKEKLLALLFLWVGLFVLVLLKGGKGVESLVGITCESPWYAVLMALQFIWLFCFASYYGWKAVQNQKARVNVRYPYFADDPVWDFRSLRHYGIFTFIAGIVAGLIGIGGGMVLGPLMLVMGIHPSVSTATTGSMIVLTSSSVAVMYVTSGLVPWPYALFYFCVCLSGAYLGKSKIDGYVKRSGRASILIFILATIIALATIGSLTIMLTRLAEKDWCLDGLVQFCHVTQKEGDICISDRLLGMSPFQK